MTAREEAEVAIRLWRGLGLVQKLLAFRANVTETAISKIAHEPTYTRSPAVYRRIRDVVSAELAMRIDSISLSVLSLCDSQPRVFDAPTTDAVIANVKDKMQRLSAPDTVAMPDGIGGAIMQMGPRGSHSGLFVIAIPDGTDNQQIMALIHELDHLKEYLGRRLRQEFRTPRSAF